MGRNSLGNRLRQERGETQIGIIVGAFVIGCLCWGIFSLEACIRTHKDSKVKKRADQYRARYQPSKKRKISGYSVKVK